MDDKPTVSDDARNIDSQTGTDANNTGSSNVYKRFTFDAVSYFIKQVAIVVISVTFLVGLVVIFWANSNGQTSDTSYKSNNMDKVAEDVDDIDLTPSVVPVSNIKSTGKILDLIGDNTYKSDSDESITSGWKQVSVGLSTTCGIKYDNRLYCWGSSTYTPALGQTGVSDSNVPLMVSTSGVLAHKEIRSVVGGYGGNCAISSDGKLYCWGTSVNWNTAGWDDKTDTPILIDANGAFTNKSITSLFVTYYGGCASTSDNIIYCWGNENSSHGYGSTLMAVNTSGVLSGKTISHMASKDDNSCVSTSEQKLYCWFNTYYWSSSGGYTDAGKPVEVDDNGLLEGKQIMQISAGKGFNCMLTSDGDVYCWGDNDSGQLGNNSKTDSKVMVAVNKEGALKGQKIVSITSGESSSCALSDLGKIFCWGGNASGQLGNQSVTESLVPVAVYMDGALSGKSAKAVLAYYNYTCLVTSGDNELYCWGNNKFNQISSSSREYFNEPIKMFTD